MNHFVFSPILALTLAAAVPAQPAIPKGAPVLEARLTLALADGTVMRPLTAHRILVPWEEMVVTWNSFFAAPAPYDPAAAGSLVPPVSVIELRDLVQAWVDGAANHGVLLNQESEYTKYFSREYAHVPGDRPMLYVKYLAGNEPMELFLGAVADTYIQRGAPDLNKGDADRLYTGYYTFIPQGQKYSLLRFDLPVLACGGCTHTPGYWKNHSCEGKARRDATWDKVGPLAEYTPFFGSGETWISALGRCPRGDAYWILAHAWIAATLNRLDGACAPKVVLCALAEAEELLEKYAGQAITNRTASCRLRAKFILLAGILDAYNCGLIGPGHCCR